MPKKTCEKPPKPKTIPALERANQFGLLDADGMQDMEEDYSDMKDDISEHSDAHQNSVAAQETSASRGAAVPQLVDDYLGDTIELRKMLLVSVLTLWLSRS